MSMHYDEIQPDTRVICHSRGDVPGTVLYKRPDGFGAPEAVVCIEFDKGGVAYNYPGQLSPLSPEDDPRGGAPESPRLTREGSGYTFWRGGHRYYVRRWAGFGAWCVTPWEEGDGERVEALAMDKRTRREALAEAVEKIDARTAMQWHRRALPSLLGGELPEGLDGEGWEVWPVPGPVVRHEVAYYGDLVGAVELHPAGWTVIEYNADGEAFPVSHGVPHVERAAMLVHASLPFAQ
ncbi:hypothetical protein [Streptomyces sp. NPDC051909]|uniref:hypothetical protein n=1 Tax=Streptomyces sp. NPDC051909 TaxID=3154944 RepID=UPI00342D385C